MTNFFTGEVGSPYQSYGLFLHPDGQATATLQADPEKLRYYTNKGFKFLSYVNPPGVAAGPRDIDRDDSGVPKGPDGSTHDRHPMEVTPDGANVPWGFPLLGIDGVPETTPRTEAAAGQNGPRGATGVSHARRVLTEAGVDKDVMAGALRQIDTHGLKDPKDELAEMHNRATLPGRLVETGVTRGLMGTDVTMPSPVSGIQASDKQGIADAIRRGDIEVEDREVAPGETVQVLRAASGAKTDVPGPSDAPGAPGASRPANDATPPDVTTTDQARHQNVRSSAMKAERKSEGAKSE